MGSKPRAARRAKEKPSCILPASILSNSSTIHPNDCADEDIDQENARPRTRAVPFTSPNETLPLTRTCDSIMSLCHDGANSPSDECPTSAACQSPAGQPEDRDYDPCEDSEDDEGYGTKEYLDGYGSSSRGELRCLDRIPTSPSPWTRERIISQQDCGAKSYTISPNHSILDEESGSNNESGSSRASSPDEDALTKFETLMEVFDISEPESPSVHALDCEEDDKEASSSRSEVRDTAPADTAYKIGQDKGRWHEVMSSAITAARQSQSCLVLGARIWPALESSRVAKFRAYQRFRVKLCNYVYFHRTVIRGELESDPGAQAWQHRKQKVLRIMVANDPELGEIMDKLDLRMSRNANALQHNMECIAKAIEVMFGRYGWPTE